MEYFKYQVMTMCLSKIIVRKQIYYDYILWRLNREYKSNGKNTGKEAN